MQPSDFDLATVVKEDDHTRSSRMHRSMIRRGNSVFVTVTCSNGKRFKWRCVQKLPNSRNHTEKLIATLRLINSQGLPESISASSFSRSWWIVPACGSYTAAPTNALEWEQPRLQLGVAQYCNPKFACKGILLVFGYGRVPDLLVTSHLGGYVDTLEKSEGMERAKNHGLLGAASPQPKV